MRYGIGFVVALAMVVSPVRAKTDEASSTEANPYAAAPFSLDYEPASPRRPGRSPKEKLDRAHTGLVVGLSLGGGLVGQGAITLGVSYLCVVGECEQPASPGAFKAGLALMAAGAAAMIASGVVYGVRKRQLGSREHLHRGRARRAQWELAKSRLVF